MKKDSVLIFLDGGVESSLDFQAQKQQASVAVEEGLSLNFELDLGLFSKLKKPLSNKSQYLSLTLSLKHFKETFFDDFQDAIESVCIYKGNLDFREDLYFDDETVVNYDKWLEDKGLDVNVYAEDNRLKSLFCRDAFFDYLHALTLDFIGSIPFCLNLETKDVNDPLFYALLTHKQIHEPFSLIVDGENIYQNKSNVAICLPSPEKVLKQDYEEMEEVFAYLIENNISYRLIPESMLITEWDLVDYLFVLSKHVKTAGKRMFQGFIAAGGTIVTLGTPLHLNNEISFSEFKNTL